ncbi:MAG: V-type ATP synthase subunit I [Anaerohalosphaeraceae bacterium]|nr:V-type ATP synthase subunit I [Anaerohalosphaeraceae bacterium]
MSVAKMQKVIIASFHTEAPALLEALQAEGVMQIYDAERSLITKEWPELHTEIEKPKNLEDTLAKLEETVEFLQQYAPKPGLAGALAPRTVIEEDKYTSIVSGKEAASLLEAASQIKTRLAHLNEKQKQINARLQLLLPWEKLQMPMEEINTLEQGSAVLGLLPEKNFALAVEQLSEFGAEIEKIDKMDKIVSCVAVCLRENISELQKTLRPLEFESVGLNSFKGTPAEVSNSGRGELAEIEKQMAETEQDAAAMASDKLKLEILADHYTNLLGREKLRLSVPETQQTVLLEGWVKKRDLSKLKKTVSKFSSSSIAEIAPGDEEKTPIEIENSGIVKPFETITRLHGMPTIKDVDPTALLAPFFAIFFGLCLTDAGYGIVLAAACWWLIKKFQGDKKAIWMLLICSATTIVAGALTGGWFGDAFQVLIPQETTVFKALNGFREKAMLFDPMKQPMVFFAISLALGYIQIMFALFIGLFNNIRQKDYATATFNFLSWIIFLNSLAILIVTKVVNAPIAVGVISKWLAIVMAGVIFLFTERKSGIAGRVGGGVFALFSTVFYFGDILSYVRLMALGMVTAGLGIAVNILVQLVMEIPYGVGFVLGAILFVGGHLLNLVLSVLSSFVHSLRLQFVEFFPKFFAGGGREFKPLSTSYKYVLKSAK